MPEPKVFLEAGVKLGVLPRLHELIVDLAFDIFFAGDVVHRDGGPFAREEGIPAFLIGVPGRRMGRFWASLACERVLSVRMMQSAMSESFSLRSRQRSLKGLLAS
jgi:hypothetical protein